MFVVRLARCAVCAQLFDSGFAVGVIPDEGPICPEHETVPCIICGEPIPIDLRCECLDGMDPEIPPGIADRWEEQLDLDF